MNQCCLTRRTFMQISAFAGLANVVGCGAVDFEGLLRNASGGGVVVFKRSGRGRHVSNAAKRHNANRLYVSAEAAALDPAHSGDKSKVVPLTIPQSLHHKLFASGRVSADLRRDL